MSDQDNCPTDLLVLGLGEALFDRFGDRTILGGAPINFAIHANQLLRAVGGEGCVVSRVGTDDLGERLISELVARGMNSQFIQVDSTHPTGSVQVTIDNCGQPDYDITEGVAWDRLEITNDVIDLASRCSAVCYGTLAQRSPSSRKTIQEVLRVASQAIRIFDLNLRQHYFDALVIEEGLKLANVVKLNEHELAVACQLLNLADDSCNNSDDRAFLLCRAFKLDVVALTRGGQGTVLFTPEQRIEGKVRSYPAFGNADSVGAGDGSCAALVCGLLMGWSMEHTLDLANEVGAFIASQPGATPKLPNEVTALVKRHSRCPEKLTSLEV